MGPPPGMGRGMPPPPGMPPGAPGGPPPGMQGPPGTARRHFVKPSFARDLALQRRDDGTRNAAATRYAGATRTGHAAAR